jgi:hypothetical protein
MDGTWRDRSARLDAPQSKERAIPAGPAKEIGRFVQVIAFVLFLHPGGDR